MVNIKCFLLSQKSRNWQILQCKSEQRLRFVLFFWLIQFVRSMDPLHYEFGISLWTMAEQESVGHRVKQESAHGMDAPKTGIPEL